MKDPAHHPEKIQKKVIRKARQEAKAEEEKKVESEEMAQQEAVEIEDQPTLKRPLNRRFH